MAEQTTKAPASRHPARVIVILVVLILVVADGTLRFGVRPMLGESPTGNGAAPLWPIPWIGLVTAVTLFVLGYRILRPSLAELVHRDAVPADYIGAALIVLSCIVGCYTTCAYGVVLSLACPVLWVAVVRLWAGIVWNVAVVVLSVVAVMFEQARLGWIVRSWWWVLVIAGAILVLTLVFGTMVHATQRWGIERAESLAGAQLSPAGIAGSYAHLLSTDSKVRTGPAPGGPVQDKPPAESDPAQATLGEPPLSAREIEVLGLVSQGCTNREIAMRLFISPATVKTHMEHILTKLGCTTRTQAVLAAHQEGLLSVIV